MGKMSDVPAAATINDTREDAHRYQQRILAWAESAITEGESFLRQQKGYDQINTTIDAIMGEFTGSDARPSNLSSLSLNQFGKIALDLKAAECDIKPFWDYKTSNKRFEPQTILAQKRAKHWWTTQHIGMKMGDILAYANAAGSGCAHHFYNDEIDDQDVSAEDPRDLLPIRPNNHVSYQNCFGVILRRERTVNYLRAKYPWAASRIQPDRDAAYATSSRTARADQMLAQMGLKSGFLANLMNSLGGPPKAASLGVPCADLFTLYVKDPRVNETQHVIPMGRDTATGLRTNWSYDVGPGEELYPRKRLIIFTRSAVLYDDTSIYWHGLFPFTKLTIDPWPWSWLGKAPLRDLLPLHVELNKLMRILSQHWDRVGRPGLNADKNSISNAALARIDTSRAGLKLRSNPVAGKGIEILHEPPMDQMLIPTVQLIIDQMKELSGVKDLTQLMNLGQIPTTETVEKILETMSPAIRMRSQVMEAYISEFAMIVLQNFFQFDTKAKRLALLGPTGLTWEDFDYDPGNMIPDAHSLWPNLDPSAPEPTRDQRAQELVRSIVYEVAPGSLLASAGITEKLLYLSLCKAGLIDAITTLEKLAIPNIGAPEAAGTTIFSRLQWQQSVGFNLNVNAQGRKATNQTMPRQVTKTS